MPLTDLYCAWCHKPVALRDSRGELVVLTPYLSEPGWVLHPECRKTLLRLNKYVGVRPS